MRTIVKFAPLALAILLVGQGCPISFGGTSGTDGGVYRSADRGEHWAQKNAVLSVGGARTIADASVLTFVPDPQDPSTIYIGTTDKGLLYSVDAGDSWYQPKDLQGSRIPAIVVDTKNKCIVYAVSGAVVVKTTDCTRTWAKVFEDTRADSALTSIALDHFNPNTLYIATTKGDIIKSTDGGNSWGVAKLFTSPASKVIVDPFDSRLIYVGTRNAGIWKSIDAGANWVDVSTDLTQFDGAKDFYDLLPDVSKRDSYLLVSRFGLVRTIDGGAHWEKVPLLTPPGQARIYAAAFNPKNGLEMYYTTATIFYHSTNGGTNWTTKRLPTSRVGSALMVSPANPLNLYLGTLFIKK